MTVFLIVFYGVKQFTINGNIHSGVIGQCGHCSNVGEFRSATKLTCLHLFWIPLIPVWFTRAIRCTRCDTLFIRS